MVKNSYFYINNKGGKKYMLVKELFEAAPGYHPFLFEK